MTRQSTRRSIDMSRLRDALRGPGIDTRVWIAAARVDTDPDAISWDQEFGWLVDVTFYGGGLDQEDAVPCRLGSWFATAGGTAQSPIAGGDEVLVAITDGDANGNPVILCRLHNADLATPATVNGDPITEAMASATHLLVTPHGEQRQFGGDRRVTAPNQKLIADAALWLVASQAIYLARDQAVPPAQQAILGNALVAAQAALVQALATFVATVAPPATPPATVITAGAIQAAVGPLTTAFSSYLSALNGALSTLVRLD